MCLRDSTLCTLMVRNVCSDSQHSEARHRDARGPEWPTKDAAEGAGQTQRHTEGRWQQVSVTGAASCTVQCRKSLVMKWWAQEKGSVVYYAQFKLQLTTEERICLFVSVGSFVLGRTLSHEASPTPPSVQSVVERATSPLTASTPGEDQLISSQNSNLLVQCDRSFLWHCLLFCSV